MQKLSFEIHRYAPELSKVFYNGIDLGLKIPHEVQREAIAARRTKPIVHWVRNKSKFTKTQAVQKFARIKKVYPETTATSHAWLNKEIGGAYDDLNTVRRFIDKFYQPESVLMDGSTLPEPTIFINLGSKSNWIDVTHIARNRYLAGKSSFRQPQQSKAS